MDQRGVVTVQEVANQLMTARDRRVLKGVEFTDMLEPDRQWALDRAIMLGFATWSQDAGGYRVPVIVSTQHCGVLRLFDLVVKPDHVPEVAPRLGEIQDQINQALAWAIGLQPEVVRLCVSLSIVECMDGEVRAPGTSTVADVVAYSASEPGRKPVSLVGLPRDADLTAIAWVLRDYGFEAGLDDTRVAHWDETVRRGIRINAWLCYMIESDGQCMVYCGERPHPEAEARGGVHVLAQYNDHAVAPMVVLAPHREAALDRWHRWTGLPRTAPAPAATVPQGPGAVGGPGLPVGTAVAAPPGTLVLQRTETGFHLLDNGQPAASGDWGEIRRYLLRTGRPAVIYDAHGQPHAVDADSARAPHVR